MGRVLTNNISLAYNIEASLGNPGILWKLLEPNEPTAFGATISKTERDPITKDRQRRKGTTTDLDSTVEFEHDLTFEVFKDFIEAFMFVDARYPYSGGTTRQEPIQSGSDYQDLLAVNATSSFDHDAITAAMTASRLVYTRGFTNAANNGMHEVDAASTTILTEVTSTLVDETPGDEDNATMELAGHRNPTATDWAWTTADKTLTSAVLDATTLGLTVGQFCHIGGLTAANQFAGGVGYGRIASITATTIVFDKFTGTLVADDAGTGKNIDLLYGSFIRNVDIDDADYLERSFHFEMGLPNLGPAAAPRWQYSKGNYANQATFNLPLSDKATITFGFVGTDTENPVDAQKTGADTPAPPVSTAAYNTSADIVRLRLLDDADVDLTTCFKNVGLTLNNQATTEKCLGTLGATYMNIGNFLVDLDAQVLFDNEDVVVAIRDNETVSMDFILKNEDGAIAVDIPSMTLDGGDREYPRNETVRINTPGMAFKDPVLDYSIGVSTIPSVPA